MRSTGMRARVALANEALSVVVADTPKLVADACRLRYQVYCLERGVEPGKDGLETDQHDEQAGHVLVIHRSTGTTLGTVRVVPHVAASVDHGFPMQRLCHPGLLRNLPIRSTGEISRFAVSKQRRVHYSTMVMVRLALMHGIVRLSHDLGLTHWCAVMEPALLRLLQMNAIYFTPLGPLVEFRGVRQPSYGRIQTVLNRIKSDQWELWDYITAGGSLCYERPERMVA